MNYHYILNKRIPETEYRLGIQSIYRIVSLIDNLPLIPRFNLISLIICAMIISFHFLRRTV